MIDGSIVNLAETVALASVQATKDTVVQVELLSDSVKKQANQAAEETRKTSEAAASKTASQLQYLPGEIATKSKQTSEMTTQQLEQLTATTVNAVDQAAERIRAIIMNMKVN